MRPDRGGFSLMEALVAMFVLAIASVGLLGATQAHIDGVRRLESRVAALWVAENRLAELGLRAVPSPGSPVTMLGRDWRVEVRERPTEDPDLVGVDIVVSPEGTDEVAARLAGFVDRGATG